MAARTGIFHLAGKPIGDLEGITLCSSYLLGEVDPAPAKRTGLLRRLPWCCQSRKLFVSHHQRSGEHDE
jgi:hypothetical protein